MGWEWVNADETHSQIIPHPELLNEPHQKETKGKHDNFPTAWGSV